MKSFNEIDSDSRLYFLYDPYGCISKYDNGFANVNSGIQLFSCGLKYFMRYVAINKYDKSLSFCIDRDIEYNDVMGVRSITFWPTLNKVECERYYYVLGNGWYVFASREGLESYIRNITDVIESNLVKVRGELGKLD